LAKINKKKIQISILVLGSRPEKINHRFIFKKIYAANAAVKLANKLKITNLKITSICADLVLIRDPDIMNIVFKEQPRKLITRGITKKPYQLTKTKIFKTYSYLRQFIFQCKFFKFGVLNILFAEFFVYGNLKEKLLNILRFIKHRRVTGVSTGFFSILYALNENPGQKIMISGIGMRDEAHFYKTNYRKKFLKRVLIDAYLSKHLKKKYKKLLYTFDKDLAEIMNINLLK
jgi:hypothetical protein